MKTGTKVASDDYCKIGTIIEIRGEQFVHTDDDLILSYSEATDWIPYDVWETQNLKKKK